MKLALISTPRSGNTWLRYLLARLYDLEQHAVHRPDALDWSQLPDNCVVQMHWHRTEAFVDLLASCGFRPVTIKRHPLDVLLSILHFCGNEPETRSWLQGEGGDEMQIHGKTPTSAEFVEYAVGPRARALLSVTAEWWRADGVTGVCYEDLVNDPSGTLLRACAELGEVRNPTEDTVAALSIENLRRTSQNSHFWQGRPGLWRDLLPRSVTQIISSAHSDTLDRLGYEYQSAEAVDVQQAEDRWRQIA